MSELQRIARAIELSRLEQLGDPDGDGCPDTGPDRWRLDDDELERLDIAAEEAREAKERDRERCRQP